MNQKVYSPIVSIVLRVFARLKQGRGNSSHVGGENFFSFVLARVRRFTQPPSFCGVAKIATRHQPWIRKRFISRHVSRKNQREVYCMDRAFERAVVSYFTVSVVRRGAGRGEKKKKKKNIFGPPSLVNHFAAVGFARRISCVALFAIELTYVKYPSRASLSPSRYSRIGKPNQQTNSERSVRFRFLLDLTVSAATISFANRVVIVFLDKLKAPLRLKHDSEV